MLLVMLLADALLIVLLFTLTPFLTQEKGGFVCCLGVVVAAVVAD